MEDNIRDAIKQHGVGVFYVWGANATKWDTFRVLAQAYPKVIHLAEVTPRPFIYKIGANARCYRIEIDGGVARKRSKGGGGS